MDKENKGAWIEMVEETINYDFDLKAKAIRDVVENPGKYPEMDKWTGVQWAEFIFGDMLDFAKKFENLK